MPHKSSRRLLLESLENRRLLVSDWTNPAQNEDVNNDLEVNLQDALIIVNHHHNAGEQLPAENPDNALFYDVNGDGTATIFDALIALRGTHRGTNLFARLESDTAQGEATNFDWISQDVSIQGQANARDGVAKLEMRLNGSNEDLFVDVTESIQSDGSFLIDLDHLPDGTHQIDLKLTDGAGVVDEISELTFTRDRSAPASPTNVKLTPDTDTGSSQTDGVTKDTTPTIRGDGESGTLVSVLVDNVVVGQVTPNSSWQIAVDLSETSHEVQAVAEDIAGNASDASTPFTVLVDMTAPTAPQNLDHQLTGDAGLVHVVGQTEYEIQVELEGGIVPGMLSAESNGSGDFVFNNVPLAMGDNVFVVRARDLAGNLSAASEITITRDP